MINQNDPKLDVFIFGFVWRKDRQAWWHVGA
jgi:hypothetical protein